MPISLDGLQPDFRKALEDTLDACKSKNVIMIPFFGIRTPYEQGKLWRQSRSVFEVKLKIDDLESKSANFLAHCIKSVGPQHGPRVTNSIPGYSWHQWGEAMDCYWLHNDKAIWDTELLGEKNGYRVYADIASQMGLTAGGYWMSLKDWPHVQKRKAGSPSAIGLSVSQINKQMEAMYGS